MKFLKTNVGYFTSLQPGHLYCAYLKEKMEETLYKFRVHLLRDSRRNFNACIDILKDLKVIFFECHYTYKCVHIVIDAVCLLIDICYMWTASTQLNSTTELFSNNNNNINNRR